MTDLDRVLYCRFPECEEPTFGHGDDLCMAHRQQLFRRGKLEPIKETISLEEKALEAASAWVDAGDDDAKYKLLRDSAIKAFRALGRKELSRAHRDAIAAAKARGVMFGRPPKVTDEQVAETYRKIRSAELAACVLGVHPRTVFRRLSRIRGSRLRSQGR